MKDYEVQDRETTNGEADDEFSITHISDEAIAIGERVFGSYEAFAGRLERGDVAAKRLLRALNAVENVSDATAFQSAVDKAVEAIDELSNLDLFFVNGELQDKAEQLRECLSNWEADGTVIAIAAELLAQTRKADSGFLRRNERQEKLTEARLDGLALALRRALTADEPKAVQNHGKIHNRLSHLGDA